MELGVLAVVGGDYVSAIKALPVVVLLFIWTRLLTWADKDAPAAHLPRMELNAGLLGGMILAFIALLALPSFLIGFGVMLLIFLAEIGLYLILRHQKVGLKDLKGEIANVFAGRAGKKAIEAPPGELLLHTAKGAAIPPPPAESPERPVYDAIQKLLTGPMKRGLERLELLPADGVAQVRYSIDGVIYSGGNVDRAEAAAVIGYLKSTAGLDLNEKRKPQKGSFRIQLEGKRIDVDVETAGRTGGEWLVMVTDPKRRHNQTLDDLGFSADQLQVIRDSIKEREGVVLLAAPKGGGLTSLTYAVLRAHDAFLEHIHTIERDPDDDLEGITQNKLPRGATTAEEAQLAAWVTSQEPDVIVATQIEDPRTAMELVKFAQAGRRAYIGLRAGSTYEALNQWRRLIGDDKAAVKSLKLVVAGRVVRRLCSACKAGYLPDPQQLRKLNIDPDRVGQLYQARTEPLRDNKGNPVVCPFCADLRFKGRIGVYEILQVTDEVKQAVMAGGDPGLFKAAFRKQRGRYLQEMALLQVESGTTSVQEVLRVLRSGEGAGGSGATPAAAAS